MIASDATNDSDSPRPQLLDMIGSTRPRLVGLPVAKWFLDHTLMVDRFKVVVADLAEIN